MKMAAVRRNHDCGCALKDVTSNVKSNMVTVNGHRISGSKSKGVITGAPRSSRKFCEVRVVCDKPGRFGRFGTVNVRGVDGEAKSDGINAMESAKIAETRINLMHRKKAFNLEQFQKNVALRVREVKRSQHLDDLNKSFQIAKENENVRNCTILPSSDSKPDNAPLYRHSEDNDKIQGMQVDQCFADDKESNKDGDCLSQQLYEVKELAHKAKSDLLKKKARDANLEALPGGHWSVSPTRDVPYSVHTEDDAISSPDNGRQNEYSEWSRRQTDSSPDTWTGKNAILPFELRSQTHPLNGKEEKLENASRSEGNMSRKVSRTSGVTAETKTLFDLVHPGLAAVQAKVQAKNKYWNYRKHFMNLEREQVRECVRQRLHQEQIGRLRKEKELERYQMEQQINSTATFANSPEDDITTEETRHQGENKMRGDKKREMNRYIKALRAVVQEKARYKRIVLPPLCSCGPSIWDAHPDTCANNCIFYKNPQAYANALSSVLASAEST